jgi:hypothetical protein
VGREITLALLVAGPTGVLASDLAPQLVRDPQAFDRPSRAIRVAQNASFDSRAAAQSRET